MSLLHKTLHHRDRYKETDDRFHSVKDLALANPAFGITAGFFPGISEESKFGHNDDVGNVYETLWPEGGLYVYVDVATTMTISSGDVDDVPGDTGAGTVRVMGLDGAYNPIEEVVSLNGQNGVTLGHKYLRVTRMQVLTAGSSLANEGIIYVGTGSITTGKPAVVHSCIEIGLNQTLMGLMTIPNDFEGYLMDYKFSSSVSKAVSAIIVARLQGGVFQVKDHIEIIDGDSNAITTVVEAFPPRTDLELRAKTGAGGGDVAGRMDFWLERLH